MAIPSENGKKRGIKNGIKRGNLGGTPPKREKRIESASLGNEGGPRGRTKGRTLNQSIPSGDGQRGGTGWGKSGGTVGGTSCVTTESCVPGVQDMVRRSVVGGSLVGLRWFWSRVSGSEATWIKSVDGSGWSGGADLVDPIVVVSPRSWRVGDGSGLLSTEW